MAPKKDTTEKGLKKPSKGAKGKDGAKAAKEAGRTGAPGAVDGAPAPAVTDMSGDAAPNALCSPDGAVLFRISSWKGLPNYECVACAYATLHLDEAIRHHQADHAPRPAPTRIVDTGVLDADGSPVQRVEPATED